MFIIRAIVMLKKNGDLAELEFYSDYGREQFIVDEFEHRNDVTFMHLEIERVAA